MSDEKPTRLAPNPPDPRLVRAMLAPARAYFAPEFHGIGEETFSRPALLVGNHTLFGILDIPLLLEHIYLEHGVFVRSLADRVHDQIPGWREFMRRMGAVEGSRENCAELMRTGQTIVVFPGGAREVFRRKDERYELVWKQRTGFARMAIEHGYDILPFASLGADENYETIFDAGDVLKTPWLRELAERSGVLAATRGGENIPPIAFGIGPTPIPRPQKLYFSVGERISPPEGASTDEASQWELREEVASSIREQLTRLERRRRDDRASWSPLRRWLAPTLHDPEEE